MEEAAAKQRASVQKQAGAPKAGGFFTVGWSSPDPTPPPPSAASADCPTIAEKEVEPLIAAAAKAQQLQPELIRAIIREESGSHPCAVSARGAMGLMQLMPATVEQFQTADPFDPAQNINTGARYLKQLMDRYKGDLKLSLAAYNAGPGRVDGNPPAPPDFPETIDYVSRIMDSLK
jgi:soluble lytic murein transglycosylase-like protein